MANIHLLTCDCGADVSVGVHQAGSQVVCECGKQLEVPPLRRLRELPIDPGETVEATPTWSIRKAVLAGSFVLAAVLAGAGIWFRVTLPEKPAFDRQGFVRNYEKSLEQARPIDLFGQWITLQASLSEGGFKPLINNTIEDRIQQHTDQYYLSVTLIGAGIVVIIVGVIAWVMIKQ